MTLWVCGVLRFSFQPRHSSKDSDPSDESHTQHLWHKRLKPSPGAMSLRVLQAAMLRPWREPGTPSPWLLGHRLLANGAELAGVPSLNGAEYKQNKAFISQAVVSLLIYFTVHGL